MSQNLVNMFPEQRLQSLLALAKNFDSRKPEARVVDGIESPTNEKTLKRLLAGWAEDAGEAYFTARNLEFLRPGVEEAEFPALKASQLIPYDTTPDNGAESYTITFEKQVGRSRISRDMKGIIPRVDLETSTETYPLFSLLLSYGYSLQEARAAMKAGIPLEARKAMRCREQMERDLNEIAFLGEASVGMKGMLNLANTATFAPAVGSKGTTLWTDKNATEILADMNGAPSAIVVATKEIETPNTMLLPTSRFELIYSQKVGDGTSDAILTYYKRNNPHIKQIESLYQLESNTGWTGCRMVVYEKNPNKLAMIVPVTFEQLIPDVTAVETVTICHIRTAGVVSWRKQGISYGDNI